MLRHPENEHLALYQTSELEAEEYGDIKPSIERAIKSTFCWVRGYLCYPHPKLGVPGRVVCPWTPIALQKQTLWMGSVLTQGRSECEIDNQIYLYRDWFLDLPPHQGQPGSQFKVILLIFSDLDEDAISEKIDRRQSRLKTEFVRRQLMIGQFHDRCEQGGVRNPAFRPLQSPIPLLAIRNAVKPQDQVFMTTDEERSAFQGLAEERL